MHNEIALVRPVALLCPLCGNCYGTKSLQFHLKWCRRQWVLKADSNPSFSNNSYSAKTPDLPKSLKYVLTARKLSQLEVKVYNNIAYQCFIQENLVKCSRCDNYWKAEKIKKHLEICKDKHLSHRKRKAPLFRSNSAMSQKSHCSTSTNSMKKIAQDKPVEGTPQKSVVEEVIDKAINQEENEEKAKQLQTKIAKEIWDDVVNNKNNNPVDFYQQDQKVRQNKTDCTANFATGSTRDTKIHSPARQRPFTFTNKHDEQRRVILTPNYGVYRNADNMTRKASDIKTGRIQAQEAHKNQKQNRSVSPARNFVRSNKTEYHNSIHKRHPKCKTGYIEEQLLKHQEMIQKQLAKTNYQIENGVSNVNYNCRNVYPRQCHPGQPLKLPTKQQTERPGQRNYKDMRNMRKLCKENYEKNYHTQRQNWQQEIEIPLRDDRYCTVGGIDWKARQEKFKDYDDYFGTADEDGHGSPTLKQACEKFYDDGYPHKTELATVKKYNEYKEDQYYTKRTVRKKGPRLDSQECSENEYMRESSSWKDYERVYNQEQYSGWKSVERRPPGTESAQISSPVVSAKNFQIVNPFENNNDIYVNQNLR